MLYVMYFYKNSYSYLIIIGVFIGTYMKESYTQMEYADVKPLRQKLHNEQKNICPILCKEVHHDEVVLDHKHKTKAEKIGVDNAGLVRGVIHFQVNAFEGKVNKAFKRCGLHKHNTSLSTVLRNLADYLEQDALPLIHPTEKPKVARLMKSTFNKLDKAYKSKYPRRKALVYPRKKKGKKQIRPILGVKWKKLLDEFSIPY